MAMVNRARLSWRLPRPGEAVALSVATRGWDGVGACVSRERCGAGVVPDVADLSQDLGRDQRAAANHLIGTYDSGRLNDRR
jgi:hypothetical protein